jgi:hypothetical protein
MKFFKLELQNREENFNQRFGGGPRVGLVDPRGGKSGAGGGGANSVGGSMRTHSGGSNLVIAINAASVGGVGGGAIGNAAAGGINSRRETPPGGGESAEAIAARLAREDTRGGGKPKRPTRDLAQGTGMHAALGLSAAGGENGSVAKLQPAAAQAVVKRKGSEGRMPGAPANLVS